MQPVTSSCLCRNSAGAGFPFPAEALEDGVDDPVHAFDVDNADGRLFETSTIAFRVRDRRSPRIWFGPGEQKEIAHYIATQTGGEYFEARPKRMQRLYDKTCGSSIFAASWDSSQKGVRLRSADMPTRHEIR